MLNVRFKLPRWSAIGEVPGTLKIMLFADLFVRAQGIVSNVELTIIGANRADTRIIINSLSVILLQDAKQLQNIR